MQRRIVVHDYSGHPFPAQLSRELARRGSHVLHLHCPSYRSGKGALERRPGDPDGFEVEAVTLGRPFEKYSPARRLRQEWSYGRSLARRIRRMRPQVVLSGNTPLFSQRVVLSDCRRRGIPFVFWQQDLYSLAMKREAERRLPVAGQIVGRRFLGLERTLLEQSDAVVSIAEDFRTTLLDWGLAAEKLHVIENWAPVDELPVREHDNDWARRHGLAGKRVLLYSGTLGRKHDPGLLLELALAFRGEPDVRVVVVSEGVGATWLEQESDSCGLGNLVLLGFQSYEALPDVLGTGDVLVAILEHEASRFAVPSKVLTYLCAARPLLAALPAENLGAKIVSASGAGVLVDPDETAGFAAAARRLLGDPDLRERLGGSGRSYAERTFDINAVGDRFERVLESVVRTP